MQAAENGSGGVVDVVRQLAFVGLGTAVTAAAGANLVLRALAEEGEKFARREQPEVERAMVVATDRIQDMGERLGLAVEETVSGGLRHFGVPTRDEIRQLALRVEHLTAKLETFGLER